MLVHLIVFFKSFFFFTASYSHNLFPEPLTKEEEEELIKKMQLGDNEARNKIIEHNLRLVAHIVKKFDKKRNDIDDLISIGTIGLIKGVDSYSSKHGTKITTYCARCIENEILMHFRSDKKNVRNVSLNSLVGYDKDGNEIAFIDIIKTPHPDYVEAIHTKNNINLLKKYMQGLNEREKNIITKRYGLDNQDELTQKQIAQELNISRSYVSRIEKRALTKILKEFIKSKNYSYFE